MHDLLMGLKFSGPSKCYFCSHPQGESVEHVIVSGELASSLRKWLMMEFGISLANSTIRACPAA